PVRQGNRALPPAMVRDLIKFQPQECVQRIGREMLALRRSALFWRRRQDHDDSSHPVPNYHPGWQTAILPSLRWIIYRCSLLYEDSCSFCPFLGHSNLQREPLDYGQEGEGRKDSGG